jgi:arsenate reductase (thioredoxin)
MVREKVLFVCIHNSARSQMAEAYLNRLGRGRFEAESAGIEPGTLNPLVVEVMKDEGIDISGNKTKGVSEFLEQGKRYAYVITVCDEASAERCPVFPGPGKRLHWGLADPSTIHGSREERLATIREIRDQIRQRVEAFVADQTGTSEIRRQT